MQILSKKLFNLIRVAFSCVLLISIAGCSFTPIGENKFDCNRKDSPNEYCRSIKAIDRSTQGELPETRYEKEFDMRDYDRAYELDSKKSKDDRGTFNNPKDLTTNMTNAVRLRPQVVSNTFKLGYPMGPLPILEGAPIRVAPVIQRIYIKSYVDADDKLIQDQIIYKEIAHSKWTGFESLSESHQPSNSGTVRPKPHREAAEVISTNPTSKSDKLTHSFSSDTPLSPFGSKGAEREANRATEKEGGRSDIDNGVNISTLKQSGEGASYKPQGNLASNGSISVGANSSNGAYSAYSTSNLSQSIDYANGTSQMQLEAETDAQKAGGLVE